ncbi:MAG: alpha/beta fold hydrolase [Thermacetogeniaceae bacterium]|jgi:pimeloyl-ACP methyl ester carboxylesterase|nr:alpha/beta hydrolase [Thermoanaerobacterales bacterium]NLN21484.1 alpha/beta hydrolase [Syntrophomonadaceae bacterium]HAF16833.1 alpha/beta hydrolase [Peptococcaceae bacterium]
MTQSVKTMKLNLNGLNVNCFTAGETGPPLILLHGGGVDSAIISWGEIITPLADNYRVFAPDLPGYGESDKPDVEYSIPFYVEFLENFMNALKLEKASLAGLSLGGGISIAFALQFPSRVDKLILIGSWGFYSKLPYHLLSYWYTQSSLNEWSYQVTAKHRKLVKWMLLYSLFGDPNKLSEELVDQVQQCLQAPNAAKAFASFQRSEITRTGVRSDLAKRLSEIKHQTLIVHGTLDPGVPVEYAKKAHQLMPNSELYLMEGCKHWAQKERPEEFIRVVKAFLKK